MKIITNQAVLKYAGKSILSNIVTAEIRGDNSGCSFVCGEVKVAIRKEDEKRYTYSVTSECKASDK